MKNEVENKENVGAFDDAKEVSSLGPPAPEAHLSLEEAKRDLEVFLSKKFYSSAKDAYVTWGEATELDHLSAATWIRSGKPNPPEGSSEVKLVTSSKSQRTNDPGRCR